MCQSSEWLDVVWALTILNKSTEAHYESVLNSSFLNRLFGIIFHKNILDPIDI